jgi:hypothetical protein
MAAPVNRTVYEFLEQAAPTHRGGAGAAVDLYYQCARFVSLFTIADMRHDFEIELDITVNGKTIGQWICENICAAYYDPGQRYTALLTEVRTIYDTNLTSDTTAKSFIKRELNNFYDTVITPNSAVWGPDYYSTRYDDAGSEPLQYDAFHIPMTYNKITSGNPEESSILVDAQMGNPLEALFKSYPKRSSVIYNYACALDAASKPIATAPDYLVPFIQKRLETTPYVIPATYIGFGSPISVQFNFNGEWQTTVSAKVGGTTITDTFSYLKKASVNELGIIAVRGGMTKAEMEADIAKLGAISLVHAIAKHIFKSLGDRLQTFSMKDSELIKTDYEQNTNLQSNTAWPPPAPTLNVRTKHMLEFTNDILQSINNYLMQTNTAYTGLHKIIYYEYRPLVPPSVDSVRAYFANQNQINTIFNAISEIVRITVNIYNLNTLMSTIYDACTARNAIKYCLNHTLFRNFLIVDNNELRLIKPSIDTIAALFTEANFRSFLPLMTTNIKQLILEKNLPMEINDDEIATQFTQISYNMNTLNENTKALGGVLQQKTIMDIYIQYCSIIQSVVSLLEKIEIVNNVFLLANILLYKIDLSVINNYLFKDDRIIGQLLKLYNADGSAMRGTAINSVLSKSHLSDALQNQFRNELYRDLVQRIVSAPINSLQDVNQRYDDIQNAANSYITTLRGTAAGNPALLYVCDLLSSTVTLTMPYFAMGIAIKLIQTNQAGLQAILTSIINTNSLNTVSIKPERSSKKMTAKKGTVKKGVRAPTRPKGINKSAFPNPANKARSGLILTIKETKIGDKSVFTALRMSDITSRIVNVIFKSQGKVLTTGRARLLKGGGSKPKELPIIDLCMKKIELISGTINEKDNQFYKNTLLYLINILSVILDDYYALKKSKSVPRVLHTSLLSRSLSTIREDEIDQTGGSRSKASVVMVQGSGAPSQQFTPIAPGSRIMVLSSAASKKFVPFSGVGRRLRSPSPPPKGASPVITISRKEGISRVEKQLYAFFWLGLDRSAQQLEIERTIYSDLLPINDLFSVGHALNQIFWQPFFNHCKEPCENIYNIFTNEYLPMMKQTLSAPARLRSPRRSASPRRTKSKRSTTRKRSKAASA